MSQVNLPMSPYDLHVLAESLDYASLVEVTLTEKQEAAYCRAVITQRKVSI